MLKKKKKKKESIKKKNKKKEGENASWNVSWFLNLLCTVIQKNH